MPYSTQNNCPCGSDLSLAHCCGPFIEGARYPETAEQLMRSRYSAHVLMAITYLWDTWSPARRTGSNPEAIADWAGSCEWLGLDILATDAGGPEDQEGSVTFGARYRQGRQEHHHLEKSLFRREQGLWRYLDHAN